MPLLYTFHFHFFCYQGVIKGIYILVFYINYSLSLLVSQTYFLSEPLYNYHLISIWHHHASVVKVTLKEFIKFPATLITIDTYIN